MWNDYQQLLAQRASLGEDAGENMSGDYEDEDEEGEDFEGDFEQDSGNEEWFYIVVKHITFVSYTNRRKGYISIKNVNNITTLVHVTTYFARLVK